MLVILPKLRKKLVIQKVPPGNKIMGAITADVIVMFNISFDKFFMKYRMT